MNPRDSILHPIHLLRLSILRGRWCLKTRALSGDIYSQYFKLEQLGHKGHVRENTIREIIEFLEEIGFDVTTVLYRGRYKSRLPHLVARVVSGLRSFVYYVARKP